MILFSKKKRNELCEKSIQDDINRGGIDVSDIPTERLIVALTNALTPIGMGWVQHIISKDNPFYLTEKEASRLINEQSPEDKIEHFDLRSNGIMGRKLGTCLRLDYILGRPVKSDIHIYKNGTKILIGSYYDHGQSPERLTMALQSARDSKVLIPEDEEFRNKLNENSPVSDEDMTIKLHILAALLKKAEINKPQNAIVASQNKHVPPTRTNELGR